MADLTALTCATVPELWKRRETLFTEHQADLSVLEEVDSAGIAFLVQWAKACEARGEKLQLAGVPPRALRLIRTFRLEGLFNL